MTAIFLFLGGFISGALGLIGYGAYRGTKSDGWDDSNPLNWIRLFSHVVVHPEDFARMYYLNAEEMRVFKETFGIEPVSPFPYISKDEFAENFPQSRPKD